MKRLSWLLVPLIAVAAACADATAPSARAPEHAVPRATLGAGWDIVTQNFIPDNETCGHYATYDGAFMSGYDWAVNGTVVAENVDGINYTNDGSPYTVSVGEVDGGVFYPFYSETKYPVQSNAACLQLSDN